MHTWLQDFRYAVRMLGKNVVLTLVIVASLAIGIGANSAIFSVVDALLLRPLPYPQPERLANIWLHSPGIGIFRDWPSPGGIPRHSKRKSFLRRDGDCATPWHDVDRPRSAGESRRHPDLVDPVSHTGRQAAARTPAAPRR